MKNIISLLALITSLSSCSSNAETGTNTATNDNYVVVLDLSDRIIQKTDQINIDTNAIRAVFEKFEKSVQRNIVVKSKDKFCLRIIPQKQSSLPGNTFENNLSIDMGKYFAAEKLVKLNEFKASFASHLGLLYQQAMLGNKNSDFSGVDIWQYFNEQINSDLDVRYNNKVMILTDGYFDFEDKKHGISNQNQSTTTAPLLANMKGQNWKQETEEKQLGIIPVKLIIPAKWVVCGIQTKANCKDLLEAEKLGFLWEQWLKNSGGTTTQKPIINSSSDKVKSLIQNNL
jgi:hypothetical protein